MNTHICTLIPFISVLVGLSLHGYTFCLPIKSITITSDMHLHNPVLCAGVCMHAEEGY